MTTSPVSAAIDDILLTIFRIITEPIPSQGDTFRPLAHVQAASQVCQRWRALLLGSTWIWGRVIDLGEDIFGPGRGKWIEEIVKRAGTSPLWICGWVTQPDPNSGFFDKTSLFIPLLESWERIEKLRITIMGAGLSDHIQRHFICRAPILKVFDVDVCAKQSSLFRESLQQSQSLFADYAPSLVQINASDWEFKLDSPWLSNVRDISFSSGWYLQDILTLLQHTHLLSALCLSDLESSYDLSRPLFPKKFFSNLSTIHLRCTPLAATAMILDHISPGMKLSVVRLNAWHKEFECPSSYTVSCLKKNLPTYISNYFATNPATYIEFMFPGFLFSDHQVRYYDDASKPNPSFALDIHVSDYNEDFDLTCCILDAFLESSYRNSHPFLFQTVTGFDLTLSWRNTRYTSQPVIFAKLYSMLAAFHSVQSLVIIEDSLKIWCSLSCLENQELILFPQLVTISLNYRFQGAYGQSTVKYLLQFLLKRKEIGRPVARLSLWEYNPSFNGVRDFTVLDQVEGLEVVWMSKGKLHPDKYEWRKYVCGTGMPERLNLNVDTY